MYKSVILYSYSFIKFHLKLFVVNQIQLIGALYFRSLIFSIFVIFSIIKQYMNSVYNTHFFNFSFRTFLKTLILETILKYFLNFSFRIFFNTRKFKNPPANAKVYFRTHHFHTKTRHRWDTHTHTHPFYIKFNSEMYIRTHSNMDFDKLTTQWQILMYTSRFV